MNEDREKFRHALRATTGELGLLFNELLNWARTSQDAEQFMSTIDIFNKHADEFMDKALEAYKEDHPDKSPLEMVELARFVRRSKRWKHS